MAFNTIYDVLKAVFNGSTKINVDSSGSTSTISGTVAVSNFPATQPVSAAALPLPAGAATSSNQTSTNTKLDTLYTSLQTINSLTPSIYDYIALSYTGSDLTSVVYKNGGSGGTTVSTLTLAYTSSVLQSVTKT